jgi:hypothetical protein
VFVTALFPDKQHLVQPDKPLFEEQLAHFTAPLNDFWVLVFEIEVIDN